MKCDAGAFAGMYQSIYQDLYRFALCMMRNPHDAEDAVSEAVVNAYGNIQSLREESAFKSWIFQILSNVCKRRWKDKVRAPQLLEEDAAKDNESLAVEVDYGFSLDVRKAFDMLSEEEQIIVGLSVFGGYKSKEIAEFLRLNASTVRSKRMRALEKMSVVLA